MTTENQMTSEELFEELRQLANLQNPKGKSCANCKFSNADKFESVTTCGVHLQNFSTKSFCAFWTKKEANNGKK
jgi:hypothetical protein